MCFVKSLKSLKAQKELNIVQLSSFSSSLYIFSRFGSCLDVTYVSWIRLKKVLAHTNPLSLSLSLSIVHTHTLSPSFSRTLTVKHSHTLSLFSDKSLSSIFLRASNPLPDKIFVLHFNGKIAAAEEESWSLKPIPRIKSLNFLAIRKSWLWEKTNDLQNHSD